MSPFLHKLRKMSTPHNHHYIPQFWLKRFSHDGRSKLVWSYDWQKDQVEQRSVKTMMAEHDLYTQQTQKGIDVSLETDEMGAVDTEGAQLFQKLDNGDRSSGLREELADFFAVAALRHPVTVNRHPSAAAGLLLNIQEDVEKAQSLHEFNSMMQERIPTYLVTQSEFDHLKSATPRARDLMFGPLFDSLLEPGGNPEVPFSDVIRDASGRSTLKDRLLAMKWVLRRAKEPDLVIGDTGIVFERGEIDLGWKIVLCPGLAMLITKSDWPVSSTIGDGTLEPWEVDNINLETAARSKILLIGGNRGALEAVAQHIKGR